MDDIALHTAYWHAVPKGSRPARATVSKRGVLTGQRGSCPCYSSRPSSYARPLRRQRSSLFSDVPEGAYATAAPKGASSLDTSRSDGVCCP